MKNLYQSLVRRGIHLMRHIRLAPKLIVLAALLTLPMVCPSCARVSDDVTSRDAGQTVYLMIYLMMPRRFARGPASAAAELPG